ncbi:MAG TPA: GspE/PulE family protein [Flavobacterium sp.]|jgi:type IV pilus assembly protein PilB
MSDSFAIPMELRQLISADLAYNYRVVPFENRSGEIMFRTDSSNLASLRSELQIVLGYQIDVISDSKENIDKALSSNYRKGTNSKVSNIHYSNDFLEKIVVTAKDIGSSDIHFEPFENKARIRFRLDGKLKDQFYLSVEEYPTIVNKIKIRSQLDISEKRLPQDGRISVTTSHEEFDIRVSVMPVLHGEKVVLRILSKDTGQISLNTLGFNDSELNIYLENIKKPNGIVLISGPTGSGKTTTLYATLKSLNQPTVNILTVEDPIEYTIEGINQVQLKENIGLDFASTLRTFLRQDPDVIMVGEIRDVATANMAIRAALTGHLVLSTIHTNSAWATVSRLIDMGVPPFMIANTLNISIAQRLIRRLCNFCKRETLVSPGTFPSGFVIPTSLTHTFDAVGCDECYHTGYSGRKAIYEILPIGKELASHIKNNRLEIDDYLAEGNIDTLKTNAISLLHQGVTSVEEVFPLLMD